MKKIILITFILLIGFGGAGVQGPGTLFADEPVMGTYAAYPLSVSAMVKPNVLIILDTSTSMMGFAYASTTIYNAATIYDGLFIPTANYVYNTGGQYFETTASIAGLTKGLNYWEGNFLNWLCMRRIDIAKIVLSGGEYVNAGGGVHLIKGFTYPANTGNPGLFSTTKSYNYHVGAPNPETYTHAAGAGADNAIGPWFTVDIPAISGTRFYIRVKVSAAPTGIIQDMAPQVRFGLEIFSPYHPNVVGVDPDQGGKIVARIGSSATDIADTVNAQRLLADPVKRDTWTQMAETLFTAAGYFGQVPSGNATNNNGPRYHLNDYTVSNADDPYYSAGGPVDCVKSSVIFISDGEANRDSNVQAYAIPAVAGEILGADNYLDNVAYWAHTTDIRAGGAGFGQAVDGKQTLTLYTVSAFGGGAALLQSAAKFGGFVDSNGNNLPDLPSEWDKDGNTIPDNYYAASSAA
ncbi:MAG: hypothetical protein EHM45_11135, partial [Desulfobacteraceae bacterium]